VLTWDKKVMNAKNGSVETVEVVEVESTNESDDDRE
jgi:hypothetical protein